MVKKLCAVVLLSLVMGCGGVGSDGDGDETGDPTGLPGLGNPLTYTLINPPGLDGWELEDAGRSDRHLYAWYSQGDQHAIAWMSFAARTWIVAETVGEVIDMVVAGAIDADGGEVLWLEKRDGDLRLVFAGGVDVDMSTISAAVDFQPGIPKIAIPGRAGSAYSSVISIHANNKRSWYQRNQCCPEAWEETVDQSIGLTVASVEDAWGGFSGLDAYFRTSNRLFRMTSAGTELIATTGQTPPGMVFERFLEHKYFFADNVVFKNDGGGWSQIISDLRSGSGIGPSCGTFSGIPLDVRDQIIYGPLGKIYVSGQLSGSWLKPYEVGIDDPSKLSLFGSFACPRYLFSSSDGAIVFTNGAGPDAGWAFLQNPQVTEWTNPVPF